ncbi:MAG: sigma-70 family RNA polymerase sigma factor [Solirubrobacteraceae bacterium]|nr:sigma-70 family RNA polymerase sigma factor [Solirubrobacteraceae bacterium]
MARYDPGRIGHDPEAFDAFYREHVELIQRFVARRVNDPHRAADLTAEIFLAAIESANAFDPARGNPTAWLYGIARVVVSGDYRRAAREERANARFAGRELLDDDDLARSRDRLDAAAQQRALHEAMAALPEGERAVLELVALDDLSLADAADVLGIRPVTARVRLHRARRRLREVLPEAAAPDPDLPAATTTPMEAR